MLIEIDRAKESTKGTGGRAHDHRDPGVKGARAQLPEPGLSSLL